MSDDMMSKIQQLKDMLNNNNQMPDNLTNIMSLLSNNSASGDKEEKGFNNIDNAAMISKMMKLMDKRKNMNDPRLTLLNALKPYLGQKRQSRIDSCAQILNMTLLSSLLKDDDD